MKLINKDALVEEIERIKKEECPVDSYEGRCKLLWFEQFLSFLDTLEVRGVNSNDAFIEKAACYLNSKLYDWVRIEHPNPSVSPELIIKQDFIKDFKNYMKGE